ncbi:MAG: YlxR family protein [Corynebacterium sp.]|uniref:YlxR family protein n=1 Tax=Corynebacterium sp. TaxID=1720 RepID=UPI0026DC319F|nr:YlxR family protein [Corynebacterium sp.]MDO5098015.1 YlxR family protein [Corynebacterium sp.]
MGSNGSSVSSKSTTKHRRPIRIRTCIAHKTRHHDSQLLRVVAAQPESAEIVLVPDPNRSLGGRGCWITPTLEAVELAEKRNAFRRALRVSAQVDTGPVRKYLAANPLDLEKRKKTEH